MTTKDQVQTVPQHVIDEFRDINVDNSYWYSEVIAEFVADLAITHGVDVDTADVCFAGFWSQGDGASYTTHTQPDWPKLLTACGFPDPMLHQMFDAVVAFELYRTSRAYSHENTVSVSLDEMPGHWFEIHLGGNTYAYSPYDPEVDALRAQAWVAAVRHYDIDKIGNDIQEELRNTMCDLYKRLEDEYNDLTSDEAVIDTILVNDLYTQDED